MNVPNLAGNIGTNGRTFLDNINFADEYIIQRMYDRTLCTSLHFFKILLIIFTPDSASPLLCKYLGELVTCVNSIL